jgi:hypothetical protein
VVHGQWTGDELDDSSGPASTSIRVLDDYVTEEPEEDEVEYGNVDDLI